MTTTIRILAAIGTLYVIGVILVLVLGWFPGPEDGIPGLAQVLAVHLTIAALVFLPFVWSSRASWLRVAFIGLAIVSLIRFGGEWWSMPMAAAQDDLMLRVATFNLEIRSRDAPLAPAFLRSIDADVIALQELTPVFAEAIVADPVLSARYPHQALVPSDDVLGLGLLSAFPIEDPVFEGGPSRQHAIVDGPIGEVRILNVHPLPARMARGPMAMPVTFDPTVRNAALGRIKVGLGGMVNAPPILLLGDLNTSPTERAFARFTSGFHDAHAEVGLGPGWTYRPDVFEPLGIGLIRIDVVLSSPALRPVSSRTMCPPAGDHCAVIAALVADRAP